MDKNKLIENVAEHIKAIRKNSEILEDRNFKIALGKVFIDIKEAKKYNNTILKDIFSL